jgi:hypothetical protein
MAEREGLPSAVRNALRDSMECHLAALVDPLGTQTLCSGSHPSLTVASRLERFAGF